MQKGDANITVSSVRIGADIGGTFTDVVILDDRGEMYFGKTLTTHEDPSIGVLRGIEQTLRKSGHQLSDINTIIHGTTLVINALIERKGVKTALLVTEGFRDQVEIGTENRYDLYDLFLERPTPLVPRALCRPIRERVLADGSVAVPLDEDQVRATIKELQKDGVVAIAVCFLHSYKNPIHEQRVAQIIQEMAPELRVSISSEVVPEIREYQRATTTIANVYVQPIVEKYLYALDSRLRERGFNGQFLLMLSAGGTCTIETAARFPIRILESGPVGGTLTAAFYSERCNLRNLLVFDMGGTTAKASLIDQGKPLTTNEFEIARAHRAKKGSGIPVKVPVVEMIEIGAGGGSIAHIDRLGLVKVGPQSAGSNPGPASYRLGGTYPTVTDADLVLGYLNPDYFLGGEMRLDPDAAARAIEEHIARPLGLDLIDAAWGIHRIVNENMANAARIHAIERGKDIRSYSLFAFGGAGPVHACNVATILGCPRIICPIGAGVASAFGFLTAPFSFDFVRSYHGLLDELNWDQVNTLLETMERDGIELLVKAGLSRSQIQVERSADMRYLGQTHEIRVPLPDGELSPDMTGAIEENFAQRYRELYAEASPGIPIETLNWRVIVSGPRPNVELSREGEQTHQPRPKGERPVYFPGGFRTVPVYERYDLTPGAMVAGPAIIEERESTMVVAPEYSLTVDQFRNLVVTRDARG